MAPCNCGKGKRPMGSAGTAKSAATTGTTTVAARKNRFTLTTSDDRKLSYGSELEAMANQRRFGGTISSF